MRGGEGRDTDALCDGADEFEWDESAPTSASNPTEIGIGAAGLLFLALGWFLVPKLLWASPSLAVAIMMMAGILGSLVTLPLTMLGFSPVTALTLVVLVLALVWLSAIVWLLAKFQRSNELLHFWLFAILAINLAGVVWTVLTFFQPFAESWPGSTLGHS